MTSTLVELDGRRRVSLGKIATHDRYLVREAADGVLILEPAVVVSAVQARLDQMPEFKAMLIDKLDNPGPSSPRRRRG